MPIAKAPASRAALHEPVRDALAWETLLRPAPLAASFPSPGTDQLAIIQYTSGTTGVPKGAALTHGNLLANAAQARAWVPSITRGEACVVYAVLPMFHAYGLTLCLTFAMSMGARLVLFPRFDPDLVLAVAKKHPATFLPLVPPIADRLLSRSRETGIPLAGTEFRVVNPQEPTRDVEPGAEGELLVRGPQVFVGAWFRTGDIVRIDDAGFVRIVDRIKELIITGGFNVAPSEVENALRQHPDVADAAVVGRPSASSGEEVVVDSLPTSLIGKVLRRDVRESLLRLQDGT